ncbi:hypothetical protein NKT34_23370 [Paenibacillus polysaccharolyticus]|uniref:hypothetical protein n=1 Tax=Paenibacillus polysaccharolyticus TaxID=582692 RepID=UPI00209F4326|nr:hypothetical protein [Paenibacillus polysaccharolyticus]MCP1136242.1 hypothetical protein [Paenibacillus polysaccharolyticus]
MSAKRWKRSTLILVLLVFPLLTNQEYLLHLAIIGIHKLLASSLNLILGDMLPSTE